MRDDSRCQKNIYCQFDVVLSNDEVQVERCRNCGKKIIYNKINGKVDSAKYLRDHIRDTVQPVGRTAKLFRQFYGTPARIFSKKTKEKMMAEWEEMRKDIR